MTRRAPLRAAVTVTLLGTVLFGTLGTAQQVGLATVPVELVGSGRILIAGLALLVPALASGSFRRRIIHAASVAPRPALVAMLAVGLYQLAFFSAIRDTGVAVGTLVTLGTAPVWTGLFGWFLDRHRPGRLWFAGTTLAVVGLVLLTVGPSLPDPASSTGVGLALLAGACWGIQTLAQERMLQRDAATSAVIGITFTGGGILLFAVAAGRHPLDLAPSEAWWLVYVGLIATAAAYALFLTGLRQLPARSVATLSLGEPAVAAALGIVFLGETLGARAILGCAMIAGALALASRDATAALDPAGRDQPPS